MSEFLWPAFTFAENLNGLLMTLERSFDQWRTFIATTSVHPDVYRTTTYHFDETIKTMIRSVLAFKDDPALGDALNRIAAMLPHEADRSEDCNIRYIWGIWFQFIFVLVRLGFAEKFKDKIEFTKAELEHRGYLDKFKAETDFADYAVMSSLFPASRTRTG
jgi:hypothetical protein